MKQSRGKLRADWYRDREKTSRSPSQAEITVEMRAEHAKLLAARKVQPIQLDGVFLSRKVGSLTAIGFGGQIGLVKRGVNIFSTEYPEVSPFIGRYCKVTIEVAE